MTIDVVVVSVVCFGVGLHTGVRVRLRRDSFAAALLIGLVWTTMLMVGGYTWYDEAFAIGLLMTAGVTKWQSHASRGTRAMVLLLIAYLSIEAVRGLLFFAQFGLGDALQKLRWPLLILIVALAFKALSSQLVLRESRKGLVPRLNFHASWFFSIYAALGVVALLVTGSASGTQFAQLSIDGATTSALAIFGNTAYAAVLVLLASSVALLLLSSESSRERRRGWIGLAAVFACQVLYDSRSGVLIVGLMVFLYALHRVRIRTRLASGLFAVVAVPLVILVAVTSVGPTKTNAYVSDLTASLSENIRPPLNGRAHDSDRILWIQSGFDAAREDPGVALVGAGLRTSGYIIAPYVYDRFSQAGLLVRRDDVDVSTSAFTALMLDTGLVGLALLLGTAFSAVARLRRMNPRPPLFILLMPVLALMTTLFANNFDIILLYVMLVPFGAAESIWRAWGARDAFNGSVGTARRGCLGIGGARPRFKPRTLELGRRDVERGRSSV